MGMTKPVMLMIKINSAKSLLERAIANIDVAASDYSVNAIDALATAIDLTGTANRTLHAVLSEVKGLREVEDK